MTVKEVIPLGEIGFDHKFCEIGISFENHLKEIVRGILLMWQLEKSTGDWKEK